MTLRPIAARWFELVTVHKDLARIMECLSRTGAVQLETQSGRAESLLLPDIAEQLKACHELARRYQAYWPQPAPLDKRQAERLSEMLYSARRQLVAWAQKADPIIAMFEQLSRETIDLDQLKDALASAGPEFPDLRLLVGAGPRLQTRLMRLPRGMKLRDVPPHVLFRLWEAPSADFALVVGRQPEVREIEERLVALKGRAVPLPPWLPSSAVAAVAAIVERGAQLAQQIQARKDELAALSKQLQIASALRDIALIEWLYQYGKDLRGSQRLAWVTGWTSDMHGTALRRALDAEGVRYIVKLAEAPPGANAPMVFSNPTWVRAFEVFARMLGTPARNESDPSLILTIIAPLIFGFMFGDVGQGLIIFVTGIALGRRMPLLRMLVPGGIMAMAFGLLFGSVFSREDVVPALWLRPLADPLTILIVTLAAGAVILIIGLLLDAIQAHWRGDAHRWWGCRAGLLAAYIGLLAVPMRIEGLVAAALGAGWYILGSAAFAEDHRLGAMARGAAEFLEQGLRLLVNTVSFARVGAFALAHAGLSIAIVDVAAASGRVGYWIVLIVGNVLVLALEGLVVGIQTTRLLLFEFFVRFLTATGRGFTPLPPPDIAKKNLSQPSLGGAS